MRMRRLLQWWWLLRNVVVVVASAVSEPTCTETSRNESCEAQQQQDRLLSTDSTTPNAESFSSSSFSCNLFYAESNLERLGLFVGVDVSKGTVLSSSSLLSPEPVLPYLDVNPQQEHAWHQDYTWEQPMVNPALFLETHYASHVLVPGPGSFGACDNDWANVRFLRQYLVAQETTDAASAGAYSYISNYTVVATKNIKAGQELVLPCSPIDDDEEEEEDDKEDAIPVLDLVQDPSLSSSSWVCVDGIRAGPSTTLPQQFGAFATRSFAKGSVVTESPVLHLDRHRLTHANQQQVLSTYWKQFWYRHLLNDDADEDDDGDGKKQQQQQEQQLLLNYCFGHENSTVLLLPYGPVVNYINHATDNNKANVAIRWAQGERHCNTSLLELKPSHLFDQDRGLALEYVALTDIAPGDELLLDYGTQWDKAWNQHTQQQRTRHKDDDYMSAATYKRTHDEPIRTETEQEKQPYPDNLWTVCYFKELDDDDDDENDYPDEGLVESVWSRDQLHDNNCLRPCRIVQRNVDAPQEEEQQHNNHYYYYTAIMERIPNYSAPDECELSEGIIHRVSGIPHHQIDLIDRPYTSDWFRKSAFRHEIGVPEGLYPDIWMKPTFPSDVSFVSSPLEPWQLQQTRWVETKEPVDEYAYEIGLDPRIHEALLGYANRMGVTDIFRQLLVDGDPFPPDTHKKILLNGQNWYVDRPVKHWQSNMHWISPTDETAHDDFLRVLAKAGFDDALQAIGRHFGWEGLVVYHLTFIGVSHCEKGYLHRDFLDVGGSAFNMIVPLILANETNPELELAQDEEGNVTGYYRYRYHVGSMVGDNTYHATAACDYRDQKEMRMAATIYMADVHAANLAQHLESLTQVYPPNDPSHLFNRRARHWKATNPKRRLPGPLLVNDKDAPLRAGELQPVTWNHQSLGVENLYRIGLPSGLQDELIRFAKQTGVYGRFRSIFRGKGSLEPQQDMFLRLKDETHWELQRLYKSSDAHYLSPADEPTFAKMLGALSRGGFDQVLAGLGLGLHKATLSVYELTFVAVQHYDPMKGLAWYSADQEEDTLMEIVVPLRLAHGVGPELMVRIDDPVNLDRAFLKHHSLDSAYVVGHNVESCMAPHNYAVQNEVMLALSIRVADITPESVDDVVANLWQHFPPEDPDFLLEKFAGRDWNQTDPSVKLASGLPEETISQE